MVNVLNDVNLCPSNVVDLTKSLIGKRRLFVRKDNPIFHTNFLEIGKNKNFLPLDSIFLKYYFAVVLVLTNVNIHTND